VTFTSDLIERTRVELSGNQLEELNELANDIDTTTTDLTLRYESKSIDRGKWVSIGLEDMYVWTFTPGSQPNVKVRRGSRLSTPSVHAAGEIVRVNSRFSDAVILKELNTELRALSSPLNGLFRVRTLDLTSASPSISYDLSGVTDILGVLGVQYDTPGSVNDWPDIQSWEMRRNQSQDDFASGLALRINESIPNGRALRLRYRAPFAELSSLTQNVENVTGLPATAIDIPPLGAAARLVGTGEARRSFLDGQPDTRRSSEVPPGSASRAAAVLLQLRDRRVNEERARLQALYPDRKWG
jgi:hypothetical protein